MKQHKGNPKETNEQIKQRLKYQLDGSEEDELYALKMLLGFEPLDDMDYILNTLKEKEENPQGEER